MPGMLPVANAHCVAQAVKTGLGLKAQINKHSVFERKNYFYADLPQGYQISQYAEPIVGEGTVVLDVSLDEEGRVSEVTILKRAAGGLTDSSVDAVWKWRYTPARVAGRTVPSVLVVRIEFVLD